MRADSFSLHERKELVLKLKEELERAGFETSICDDTSVQVADLSIPKIAPLDTTRLTIRVDEDRVNFAIIFKFIKLLEDCIEADEIHKVHDLDNYWLDTFHQKVNVEI